MADILLNYTSDQINDSIRKSLNPSQFVSYLPKATPFTTASIVADTPTKILVPTTQKYNTDFVIKDISGDPGNLAIHFVGAVTRKFQIVSNTGMQTGTNNVIVVLEMWKNGAQETGVSMPRKVGTGSDTGAVGLSGVFEMAPEDYIEIYLETSLDSTVIFLSTSIAIIEVN